MAQKKKQVETIDMSDVMTPSETIKLDLNKTTNGNVKIDDSAMINVKSNVFGELVYLDNVTKEEVHWAQCGDIQTLSMGMLRHMKASSLKFFSEQLVIITGFADENADKYETADIYKTLFITQYYKNFIDPTDYAEVCSWSPAQIKEKLPMVSKATKANIIVALNTYIEKGVLDSLKAIKTFEEVLGCELREPD